MCAQLQVEMKIFIILLQHHQSQILGQLRTDHIQDAAAVVGLERGLWYRPEAGQVGRSRVPAVQSHGSSLPFPRCRSLSH